MVEEKGGGLAQRICGDFLKCKACTAHDRQDLPDVDFPFLEWLVGNLEEFGITCQLIKNQGVMF